MLCLVLQFSFPRAPNSQQTSTHTAIHVSSVLFFLHPPLPTTKRIWRNPSYFVMFLIELCFSCLLIWLVFWERISQWGPRLSSVAGILRTMVVWIRTTPIGSYIWVFGSQWPATGSVTSVVVKVSKASVLFWLQVSGQMWHVSHHPSTMTAYLLPTFHPVLATVVSGLTLWDCKRASNRTLPFRNCLAHGALSQR